MITDQMVLKDGKKDQVQTRVKKGHGQKEKRNKKRKKKKKRGLAKKRKNSPILESERRLKLIIKNR